MIAKMNKPAFAKASAGETTKPAFAKASADKTIKPKNHKP
jgi:hypothetical protein